MRVCKRSSRMLLFVIGGPCCFVSTGLQAANHTIKIVMDGNTKAKCKPCAKKAVAPSTDTVIFTSDVAPWCVSFKRLAGNDHSPFGSAGNLTVNICGDKNQSKALPVVAVDCQASGDPECTYNFTVMLTVNGNILPSDDPTIIVDPGGGSGGQAKRPQSTPKNK